MTGDASAADLYDIAIVGAGAAGLMAGICAGRALREHQSDARVVLLDGAKRIGAKILVSGGGRCNVTHDVVRPDDFSGPSRNQVKKVLASLKVRDTVAFFEDLGIDLKQEDTGKLFPTTDKARTVLDALLRALRESGAQLREDHRVTAVSRDATGFTISHSQGTLHAHRVILATGGRSLPKTGSDGFGYTLARTLGHTVTDTWPALVPLILEPGHWLTSLAGIAVDAELTLASSTGKALHRRRGPMLATHFGISGPAPMDLSRHRMAVRQTDPGFRIVVSLAPEQSLEQVDAALLDAAQRHPKASILAHLPADLPERFARTLLERELGIDPATRLAQLPKDDRRAIAHALTALPLPIIRDRGYNHAEVTAGGVPLDEVELRTMASRPAPGLHLCGEILDCDGRIGGYNFQWAWCTGRLAGRAAAASLTATDSV